LALIVLPGYQVSHSLLLFLKSLPTAFINTEFTFIMGPSMVKGLINNKITCKGI